MKVNVMIKKVLMKKTPHTPRTSVYIKTRAFKSMNQRCDDISASEEAQGKELTPDQQTQNSLISSIRIVIEHIIAGIKRCRIVKELSAIRRKSMTIVMEIACALHNFRVACGRLKSLFAVMSNTYDVDGYDRWEGQVIDSRTGQCVFRTATEVSEAAAIDLCVDWIREQDTTRAPVARKGGIMNYPCPECSAPLVPVTYPSGSMLNEDRGGRSGRGDYCCVRYSRLPYGGQYSYRYYWAHELQPHCPRYCWWCGAHRLRPLRVTIDDREVVVCAEECHRALVEALG